MAFMASMKIRGRMDRVCVSVKELTSGLPLWFRSVDSAHSCYCWASDFCSECEQQRDSDGGLKPQLASVGSATLLLQLGGRLDDL
jgi:hypothetical protein